MIRSGYTFCITAVFILAVNASYAQADNEVYLFSLHKTNKGEYHLYDAKYLSTFNRGGYTNQPAFTPTGDLLVSVRKPGETQNDIYQLSLKTRKYKRLTRTSAIEYSPRIHPDEEHLTVI